MRTPGHLRAAVLGLLIALSAGGALSAQASVIEGIRKELLTLPYYGVFDFLAFSYDKGTVTLMGYAYRPVLKADAERAVRRVAGVEEVANRIEELPSSQLDDELRWKAYYAIYADPFLSRYAPGGGLLWGHRHAFAGTGLRPFGPGPFAGFELAGDYPIHIIVKGGRITLLGIVDNEGDKTLAGIKVSNIGGSFGVENQLMVETRTQKGETH
jgi:hyperosmotically inducible protein